MRLDSGNFTPDQVEWVSHIARRMGRQSLSPSRRQPGTGGDFLPDLAGTQGAATRTERSRGGGRLMYPRCHPIYTRVVEQHARRRTTNPIRPPACDLPPREHRSRC